MLKITRKLSRQNHKARPLKEQPSLEQRQSQRQLQMQISMRALMRAYTESPMFLKADELLQKEAANFLALYPDDEAAAEEIMRELERHKRLACSCGSTSLTRQYGQVKAICDLCNKSLSLTAQCKFLKGMHKPRLYLATLYIKSRCGVYCVKQFAKFLGYSYAACYELSLKVDIMLLNYLKGREAIDNIDSAEFESCCTRRSTRTPANQKPAAEQLAAEEAALRQIEVIKRTAVDSQKPDLSCLPEVSQAIFPHLSNNPRGVDSLMEATHLEVSAVLSGLTMLELEGLVERVAGDRYVVTPRSKSEPAVITTTKPAKRPVNISHRATVKTMIPILRSQRQGFSRKHLLRYTIDTWRVLEIFAGGQPLNLLEIAIKSYRQSKITEADLDCPIKVSLPFVPFPRS